MERIDQTHKVISANISRLSHRIDSFFGTQRGDEEANQSRLRLYYDTRLRQREKMDNGLNIRFSLKLPTLEKLLKFDYEKEASENTSEEGTQQTQLKGQEKTKESLPSHDYFKRFINRWSFNINTGVRVDIPPTLYARARLRRNITFLKKWEFNPTQELNWFSRGGWGALFSHDLDRKLTNSTLLRLVNTVVWNNDNNETTTTHGPQILHQIDDTKGISYNAFASGSNRPLWAINNYQVSIQFRHRIHSNWLFYTLTPAVDYPREYKWKNIYSLFIRIEALFGAT